MFPRVEMKLRRWVDSARNVYHPPILAGTKIYTQDAHHASMCASPYLLRVLLQEDMGRLTEIFGVKGPGFGPLHTNPWRDKPGYGMTSATKRDQHAEKMAATRSSRSRG